MLTKMPDIFRKNSCFPLLVNVHFPFFFGSDQTAHQIYRHRFQHHTGIIDHLDEHKMWRTYMYAAVIYPVKSALPSRLRKFNRAGMQRNPALAG